MGEVVQFRTKTYRKPKTEAEVLIHDMAKRLPVPHIVRFLVYELDEVWTQEEVIKIMDELGVGAKNSKP